MKKILLFLGISIFLFGGIIYALNISRVKTWSASDVLTASDLNAEFDNIVNHSIVNADISASAGITASKLDLTVGTPLGSTTASTGAFSTLTASGATTLNGDTTIGNATGDALTFHPSAWTLTNAVTVTGTWTNLGTVTTADINGGTIDGCTITGNISGNAATVTTNANLSGDVSSSGNTTTIGATKVTSSMLNTATSEVTVTSLDYYIYSGGAYAFFPQKKVSVAGILHCTMGTKGEGTNYPSTSYSGYIYAQAGGCTGYLLFTYVTSSGEDYWLWLLVDKNTKEVITMNGAPDHIAYGNSNDFDKQPHPFTHMDLTNKEVVLIEKSQAKAIQQEAKDKGLSVLELVDNNYKVDFSQTYPYVPIHSGQFSPDKAPVLVEKIPDYIIVRKLLLLTDDDKLAKENRRLEKQAEYSIKKLDEEFKRNKILEKIGITKQELEEILK